MRLLPVLLGAVIGGALFYKVGIWKGEGMGYAKRDLEIAAQVIAANKEIDELNEALIEARSKLIAGRENAASKAVQSLKDLPIKARAECASKCSMPETARAQLEAIQ